MDLRAIASDGMEAIMAPTSLDYVPDQALLTRPGPGRTDRSSAGRGGSGPGSGPVGRLVVGCTVGTILLISVPHGLVTSVVLGHCGPVRGIAIPPGRAGYYLTVSVDRTLRRWSLAHRSCLVSCRVPCTVLAVPCALYSCLVPCTVLAVPCTVLALCLVLCWPCALYCAGLV